MSGTPCRSRYATCFRTESLSEGRRSALPARESREAMLTNVSAALHSEPTLGQGSGPTLERPDLDQRQCGEPDRVAAFIITD